MEVFHREIKKWELDRIVAYQHLEDFQNIFPNKDIGKYMPVIECFSEEIWNSLPQFAHDKECSGRYKFSPGKMQKNLIRLYLKEIPVDYAILEIVDDPIGRMGYSPNGSIQKKYDVNNVQEDYFITVRAKL